MDILNQTGKIITEMPMSDIQNMHDTAIGNELLQYKTSLASLEIVDENLISINHNDTKMDIEVSSKAYNDILNLGLFTSKMKNTFQKILKDKTKTIDLLNKFRKELIANQGDIPVVLVGNAKTQHITNIIQDKKGHDIITNSEFLKYVYSVVNRYDLEIVDFSVNKNGSLAINTITKDHSPIVVKSLNSKFGIIENETFHRGLHFSSEIGEYKIVPTTVRIICANQITLSQIGDTISFNSLKLTGKARVENQLHKLKRHNFVPDSFIKQVQRAYETPASLAEFDHVTGLMQDYSRLEDKDLDTYINYSEIRDTFEAYEIKKGIVLNKYMKSQIPTNKTVWELINSMTYMASNAGTSVLSDNQRNILSTESGKMLRGDSKNGYFDLQLKYDNPFAKKWY